MINSQIHNNKIVFTIRGDWNILTSRQLELASKDFDHIIFHLESCRILDSEAIICLCKWLRNGKKVEIKNPPALFGEILKILSLEDYFYQENNFSILI